MIHCTVGVMAYNEEQNIVQALYALLNQQLSTCTVVEIIVVASGCTDRTAELAREVARSHPIVTVEVQHERLGKATAINRLIQLARSDVIVLVGADTLPDPTALEHLVRPLADPTVGMTGARVVPLNDLRTYLGLTTHILWQVYHRMALRWPKLGELVAFRKVVSELPVNTATDEVALEALISRQGYRLVYTPEAVVYNRGPQTLSDFVLQRRRIFAGHLHIAATYGYVATSMHPGHLISLMVEAFNRYSFLLPLLTCAIGLEVWARLLGALDFLSGHRHHIWRPARSTKRLHRHSLPLVLVVFQCREGSIKPTNLLRILRRIPESEGTLFWWYRRQSQVLFIVPADEATLEWRVNALATYLAGDSNTVVSPVLSCRIVRFAPPSPLPDLAELPNYVMRPAPAF